MSDKKPAEAVYIVDGARSPFLRARGRPGPFTAADLAVKSAQPLLLRQPFEASELDEVILGCIVPAADEANIARVVSLRLGCGHQVPAWTVQRNCGSGMQAIDSAYRNIRNGDAALVLAGGVEAMSHAPILYNRNMVEWLAELNRSRTLGERLQVLARFRPGHLRPVISLLLGLTDPVIGLSMGRTAEILADRFRISREAMDEFSVNSHHRLLAAQQADRLEEVEVIFDGKGTAYATDDGVRPDSNMEALAKLKPVFDRPHGKVTAGNSAQVTDGAAWLLLASETAVQRHNLTPLVRIMDCCWAGLDPRVMGLGPVNASARLLQRNQMKLAAIDEWEINEAFAAQVLACLAAMADTGFCRSELGLAGVLGDIDPDHLNIDGGGISLGHPVGASGARITLHLMKTLLARRARHGIASQCIGGGQGGAMLLERVQD
ncbi:MAG: acetyl-CoA C-acetyltransferase [Thiotrichales bacterium]|nr:acetyl-CoA C-acetyltransferase [Thiotrichales bacterium]